jgi:catechol 2,3-dioxygenase-like lactoylglutathione lyase family enzyme
MAENRPTHIDHILLFCRQPLLSRKFYQETLGFKIDSTLDEITALSLGETRLLLYPIGGNKEWLADEASLGPGIRLYFTVPDVDAFCEKIKATGTRIYNFDNNVVVQEPINRAWGVREFGVVDPDGYRLYFLSPLPGRQLP